MGTRKPKQDSENLRWQGYQPYRFFFILFRNCIYLYLCFIKNNGQCRYKYLVLRSYFVKKTFWFSQFFFWNWYHQHARVFDWQHFCYVWWMCFSTDSPLTYGYKLCSSLTFSFICMRQTYFKHILLSYKTRQTSYRGFSRKIKRS